MIRIVATILIFQIGLSIAAIHWLSGEAFISINRKHLDENKEIVTQRYVQTVNEKGTLLFGAREEALKSHHRILKLPEWSGNFSFPSEAISSPPATRDYRIGVNITSHDKGAFKATYLFIRIWLIEFLTCFLVASLWFDKWLTPLFRRIPRSRKKRNHNPAATE
ncbi:hypothetical protein [Luteolibacter sp. AS25]|uniref:hypothetical protein n=1 Tax=Luteolibacter sp. AS25 TaxID=3135776 RepID=UPI00398A7AD1